MHSAGNITQHMRSLGLGRVRRCQRYVQRAFAIFTHTSLNNGNIGRPHQRWNRPYSNVRALKFLTLPRIRTVPEFSAALKKEGSKKRKLDLLKQQLKIVVHGFGLEEFKQA